MTDQTTEQGKKPKLSEEERTPFLANSLPMRVFHVRFGAPEMSPEKRASYIRSCLAGGVFAHIDPAGEAETAIGYCDARDPACIEPSMINATPVGGRIVVGVRIDTLKINGSTLRIRVAEKIKELKAAGKPHGKFARKELKEQIKRELRKTVPPTSKTIPIVWTMNDGVLRVFTSSAAVADEVALLFNNTFGSIFRSAKDAYSERKADNGPPAIPTSPRAMALIGGLLDIPDEESDRAAHYSDFHAVFDRTITETVFVDPATIKVRRED